MILYHGTNIDFNVIDLTRSNKYKDFGQGFYLTDIRSQAEELAVKKLNYLVATLLSKNMILTNLF